MKDSRPLRGCRGRDALGSVSFSFAAACLAPQSSASLLRQLLAATLLLCRCCFLHVASYVAHSREKNKRLTPVSPVERGSMSVPPWALMGLVYDWLSDVCQNTTESWRGVEAAGGQVWPFLVLCMEKEDQPRSPSLVRS